MKKLLALCVVVSLPAFAQHYDSNPNADRPAGASGPGVSYTQIIVGKVIGVGSQIVKNVPTEVSCKDQNGNITQHSNLNAGSIIGAVAGGLAGNYAGQKLGSGNDKHIGAAVGVIAGAIVGNEVNKYQTTQKQTIELEGGCQMLTESRIIGWSYTAAYGGLQVQGVMSRQPQIGEDVKLILTSTLHASE
jgi:uncharacterized protein YcfJ